MRIWLRDCRRSKGYTQEKMASLLNISRQEYNFIERGKRQKTLKLETASKIANIFRISLKRINEFEEARKTES